MERKATRDFEARFLRQTWALFRFGIKNRYCGSVAGTAWVAFLPLSQFLVLSYVFQTVVRIDQEHYGLFLALGFLPWIFIASTVEMTVGTFINHSFFFRTVTVSPVSFVIAQVMDNFFVLAATIGCVLAVLLWHDGVLSVGAFQILGLSVALLCLCVTVSSLSVILATYQVYFRDLRYVVGFVIQLLFFATPIVYPFALVPERFQSVVGWNPVHLTIHPIRQAILGPAQEYTSSIFLSMGLALLSALAASVVWRKKRYGVLLRA